jgi:hypothetical protein
MKAKHCVIAIAVSLLVAMITGETAAETKWRGGLRFGLNSSQFRGDPAAGWVSGPNASISGTVHDAMFGVVVGAFVRHQTGEHFGVQVEVNYSQQGGEGAVTGTVEESFPSNVTYDGVVNGDLTVRMDYIEVPVLFLYAFPSEDRVGMTVYLGPAFGYNSRAEAQLTGEVRVPLPDGSDRVSNFDERIPIGGGINNWQVAGVVGAALDFEMKSSIFSLEGRYTFGVTSVDKSNQSDIYNHVFTIAMAYKAPFQW